LGVHSIDGVALVATPLVGAVLFIIVSATFYSSLGSQVTDLNTDDAAVRTTFPPLNHPTEQVPPHQAEAAPNASVDAFHVASIAAIILLIGGAAANQFGLRGAGAGAESRAEQGGAADPSAEPAAGAG